jgi:serine/threonine-protein kinase
VAGEQGSNRPGDFVCGTCKADPHGILKTLLDLAKGGVGAVAAIRGYTIQRELGRGGMGAVYLARHEDTGERVALKIMLPKVAVNEWARAMFLREMENSQMLKHPHVVRLHDSGCSNGVFYFTVDYCDGGSVDKLMEKQGGKLTVREAGGIILQALDGLDYVHNVVLPNVKLADGRVVCKQGLVHRDLSPQNILLSGSGKSRVAKIGDVGLGKAFEAAGLSGLTRTGALAGKPNFMARQQVLDFRYAKPEVDLWATAACFYFMLTGRPPRNLRKGVDPWRVALEEAVVPIRKRDDSIPAALAAVIDEALIDMPAIRFKKAKDLKQALEAAL